MDQRVPDSTFVLVNPPAPLLAHYLPIVRSLDGAPVPARTRVLVSGLSEITLRRPDEHTLLVTAADGFLAAPFDGLFRGSVHPFALGDVVQLAGCRVEIQELTQDGRPATVAFRFDRILEDPDLRWLQWQRGEWAPLAPPPTGGTTVLPAVPLEP